MENKRVRCTNWEKEEKQLLKEIIKPYIGIIENKNLSTNTNKAKMAAWTELTEKFNIINSVKRNKNQIINQWKMLKINTKKELAKHRHDTLQTGGEPKPPTPSLEALELVDLLPTEFEIDWNEFDCDGTKDKENEKNLVNNLKNDFGIDILNVTSKDGNNDKDNIDFDPPHEQPTSIASKRTAKKMPKMRKKTGFNFAEASYKDMHEFRVLENKRLQKEHELRVKNMEEVHEQMLINLKIQQEIFTKTLALLNK